MGNSQQPARAKSVWQLVTKLQPLQSRRPVYALSHRLLLVQMPAQWQELRVYGMPLSLQIEEQLLRKEASVHHNAKRQRTAAASRHVASSGSDVAAWAALADLYSQLGEDHLKQTVFATHIARYVALHFACSCSLQLHDVHCRAHSPAVCADMSVTHAASWSSAAGALGRWRPCA